MASSWSRNACSWSGEVILISASVSVSLTSRAQSSKAIFASFIFFGMPSCTLSLSIINPWISLESSTLPPSFFSTLMSSVSTMYFPFSLTATCLTALRASGAKVSFAFSAPFPVIAVFAISRSISSSLIEIVSPISFNISSAFSAAIL
ncbi:MAG: hypothetical protein AMQ74_01309 [Candidatus Methanofastidiosum methylothiophilum]|uniref:Uncharacterized protein n=1 Tax=Candidatus Methanofastidiosum methylothiophilum TaxID=1705564 RepID=A0A150IYS3_9EURY|nr:MAG: hypothetical protein AMQ74_01309 [Candidatus Methanofastidiosum methylthiophilus]